MGQHLWWCCCVLLCLVISLWHFEESNPLAEATLTASWVTVSSLCTSECRTSDLVSVLPGSETANLRYFSMKRVWGRSVPLFPSIPHNNLCTSYKWTRDLKTEATGFIMSLEKRKKKWRASQMSKVSDNKELVNRVLGFLKLELM